MPKNKKFIANNYRDVTIHAYILAPVLGVTTANPDLVFSTKKLAEKYKNRMRFPEVCQIIPCIITYPEEIKS